MSDSDLVFILRLIFGAFGVCLLMALVSIPLILWAALMGAVSGAVSISDDEPKA